MAKCYNLQLLLIQGYVKCSPRLLSSHKGSPDTPDTPHAGVNCKIASTKLSLNLINLS